MKSLPIAFTALALLYTPGCKDDERRGLPPASEWHQPTETAGTPEMRGPAEGEMPQDEVHGGMGGGDMGGGDMGGMPQDETHGGMGGGDMGGAPAGHGGAVDTGGPVDPNKFLEGTLVLGPAAQKAVKSGMTLYLSTKPVSTPDCVVRGIIPSASQKVVGPTLPFKFKLTEKDAQMMGGSTLDGEYLLCAHLSTTGDASKKVPGDIFGSAKVKVPQKDIKITLDQVL